MTRPSQHKFLISMVFLCFFLCSYTEYMCAPALMHVQVPDQKKYNTLIFLNNNNIFFSKAFSMFKEENTTFNETKEIKATSEDI